LSRNPAMRRDSPPQSGQVRQARSRPLPGRGGSPQRRREPWTSRVLVGDHDYDAVTASKGASWQLLAFRLLAEFKAAQMSKRLASSAELRRRLDHLPQGQKEAAGIASRIAFYNSRAHIRARMQKLNGVWPLGVEREGCGMTLRWATLARCPSAHRRFRHQTPPPTKAAAAHRPCRRLRDQSL